MKFSILVAITALVAAVVASPAPAEALEGQVDSEARIFEGLTPFSGSPINVERRQDTKTEELIAAAGLVFNGLLPLTQESTEVESDSDSLEKRAVQCKKGYGLCPKTTNKCCPLGGYCCKTGCCAAGSWCYSTGCCKNNQIGCDGKSCCPKSSRCCKGGGCCAKGYNCWISAKGKRGCCPVGKVCA